jgi:hypothetical protein
MWLCLRLRWRGWGWIPSAYEHGGLLRLQAGLNPLTAPRKEKAASWSGSGRSSDG